MVYMCGGQNAREKKKKKRKEKEGNVWMKEKAKKKNSQFKNTITIFSQ